MNNYDTIAASHGVTLAPFTAGYLDLFGSKGRSVLERFIKANPDVRVISTTELVKFVGKEEKEQRRFE